MEFVKISTSTDIQSCVDSSNGILHLLNSIKKSLKSNLEATYRVLEMKNKNATNNNLCLMSLFYRAQYQVQMNNLSEIKFTIKNIMKKQNLLKMSSFYPTQIQMKRISLKILHSIKNILDDDVSKLN